LSSPEIPLRAALQQNAEHKINHSGNLRRFSLLDMVMPTCPFCFIKCDESVPFPEVLYFSGDFFISMLKI
jgi:hypothetical protein